jgi:hypothetical protein
VTAAGTLGEEGGETPGPISGELHGNGLQCRWLLCEAAFLKFKIWGRGGAAVLLYVGGA